MYVFALVWFTLETSALSLPTLISTDTGWHFPPRQIYLLPILNAACTHLTYWECQKIMRVLPEIFFSKKGGTREHNAFGAHA
jgi:hypothetical protein